jgi:hypothetical protein
MLYLGVITRSHPTQGTIQLRIANGFEVEELHDAAISSPANNDLFVYELSTTLWKNKSAATLGLATLESPTFTTRIYTPAIRNILNTDLVVDAYNDTGAGTHFLHNFNANDGRLLLATNGGGLTFPNGTTQTVAGIPDAPSDGTPYVRLDGAWEQLIIT